MLVITILCWLLRYCVGYDPESGEERIPNEEDIPHSLRIRAFTSLGIRVRVRVRVRVS